jgi:hypothetical protein
MKKKPPPAPELSCSIGLARATLLDESIYARDKLLGPAALSPHRFVSVRGHCHALLFTNDSPVTHAQLACSLPYTLTNGLYLAFYIIKL